MTRIFCILIIRQLFLGPKEILIKTSLDATLGVEKCYYKGMPDLISQNRHATKSPRNIN